MAKRPAPRSAAKSPRAAKKPARSPAPASADHDDLDAILAESERENETLITVLEQAQRSQRGLATAQQRIKELENRHEAEHRRATTTLASERDSAQAALSEAQAAAKNSAAAVSEANKAARQLATAVVRLGDPLDPLEAGDASKDLDRLRDAVKALSTKDADANPEDLLGRSRELVEVLAGRVSQQSNRVKLLRKHGQQLDGDLGRATKDSDALRKSVATHEKSLTVSGQELKAARTTIGGLEKEVAQVGTKLERQTRTSLDLEAKALRERERLTLESGQAAQRADGLAKDVVALRAQVHAAEHLAADLGQLLLDSCEEMAKVEPGEGPATELARRELAELVATLSDADDDDLEAALREDVCEDLLPTGRALIQVLVKRHRFLGDRLASARRKEETTAAKAAKLAEQLDGEKSTLKTTKQDLTRSEAQLRAAAQEIEHLGKELATRVHELGEAKGDGARLAAENESLGRQAELAKQLRSELDTVRSELGSASRDLERQQTDAGQWQIGLRSLARALVELAGATESALVAAGLKPEGFIGRFTRSMRKLENDVGTNDDVGTLLKSSLDMAEKAASRIGQLERELRLRGETLAAAERDRDQYARNLADTQADRDARALRLQTLETEAEHLGREAQRAQELTVQAAAREAELTVARSELAQTGTALKQTRAELEELRAREAATNEHLTRDLEQTRARLNAEQQARRVGEASLAEAREDAEARLVALTARSAELEKAVESREQRLASAVKDAASAHDKAGKLADEKKKADQARARAAKAEDRIKTLEAELEDARSNADAADEAEALRSERDDLAKRLRDADKRAAEATGAAAKATATAESLKRKNEERQTSHRSELDAVQERLDTASGENRRLKEQLAGLNARVRTLTDLG